MPSQKSSRKNRILSFCQDSLLPGAAAALSLEDRSALADQVKKALSSIMEHTANTHAVYMIGMPLLTGGTLTEVSAVIHRGMLVGYLSCDGSFISKDGSITDTNILPDTTVFSCGGLRFCVLSSSISRLPTRLGGISRLGCGFTDCSILRSSSCGQCQQVP